MSRWNAVAAVCLLAVGAVVVGASGASGVDDPGPKIEYKVVSGADLVIEAGFPSGVIVGLTNPRQFETYLNENYGDLGWELCAATNDGLVFKRIKK